jgi:hypothetical protein
MKIMIANVLVIAVVSCGKSRAELEDEEHLEFAGEYAFKEVVEIKGALASPAKAYGLSCLSVRDIAFLKTSHKYEAVAAELEPLCTHDVQVATLKIAAEKVEAARKERPDDHNKVECFDSLASTAVKELDMYKTMDDAAKALRARFNAACPEQKL